MIYLYGLNDNGFELIIIGIFVLSIIVQILLKSKIKKYSKTASSCNKSGAEIAKIMLADNGIYDVQINEVNGFLSDHYNPINKTLNLSSAVYHGKDVGSMAIAAHECGHAIQHNRGYLFLSLRSAMVPVLTFSSKFLTFFILAGLLLIDKSLIPLEIGIILFATTTLFSFITLPVELNASSRALSWLDENRIIYKDELNQAKSALSLAAMTYVLAALSSLAELLRLISIVNSRKED